MAADVTEETAVAVVVTVAEVEVEADAGRGAQGREVSVRPREPDPAGPELLRCARPVPTTCFGGENTETGISGLSQGPGLGAGLTDVRKPMVPWAEGCPRGSSGTRRGWDGGLLQETLTDDFRLLCSFPSPCPVLQILAFFPEAVIWSYSYPSASAACVWHWTMNRAPTGLCSAQLQTF